MMPNPNPPRRVVVKEANWLGDVVMTLPALRAIRGAFPRAELVVVLRQELAGLFESVPWVDRVIGYRVARGVRGVADRWNLIATIRALEADLAVVIPKSFESALWMAAARIPRRAGFATQGRGWMLTDRAPAPDASRGRHQVHDYVEMLETTIGIGGSAEPVVIEAAPARRARMRDWLSARRRRPDAPLVALAPAAAYGPAKEWPAERFAALIDHLGGSAGVECVLVGTPAERERCAAVAASTRQGAIVAAGETDVGDLVGLLSLCRGFAGNDSGAMHVAAALGLPTVGIFGSTEPDRTSPLGPRTRVVRERIECSPCFDRSCRFGHYECLKRISVDHVVAALTGLEAIPSRSV